MTHYSNQELISSIQNGDDNILFYLTKKYYQSARRWLRRSGCRDSETPSVFSKILIKVCREIQQNKISLNVDFEHFFLNSVSDYLNQVKSDNEQKDLHLSSRDKEIIGNCFSIMDESARKILSARYVERLSFEEIAARLNFSNPVIAQFEFNKAFSQFEKIAMARMNLIPA